MGNILLAVLFTDKYSIAEIRLLYWEDHDKEIYGQLILFSLRF